MPIILNQKKSFILAQKATVVDQLLTHYRADLKEPKDQYPMPDLLAVAGHEILSERGLSPAEEDTHKTAFRCLNSF